MEDPQRQQPGHETEDDRRRREEELERLLLAQEEAEEAADLSHSGEAAARGANAHVNADAGGDDDRRIQEGEDANHHNHNHNNDDFNNFDDFNRFNDDDHDDDDHDHDPRFQDHDANSTRNGLTNKISYVQASLGAALALLYYALRSRQQWYLAMTFLASSKLTYIVWGNALVAVCISVFFGFCNFFLKGLRLPEAEGLGDFFRWNITETCLALTMFRASLDVTTGCLFVALICLKCLHWVVDQREGHLRMTEESIVVQPNSKWPAINGPFVGLLTAIITLQMVDLWAVTYSAQQVLENGPSVWILFAFESAILLVSALSNILLWSLHLLDGLIHFMHEITTAQPTSMFHHFIHPWKDHRATLVFAVEVQAQAAKFVFYLTFFAIVWVTNGIPLNLIREVYSNFRLLKERIVAFAKYRKLMSSMKSFDPPTQEQLDDAGSICIICRDEMTVQSSKCLPGCGHIFHKSCLREWLVQQQSCPTCRSDIPTMQARQRTFGGEQQHHQGDGEGMEEERGGDNEGDGDGENGNDEARAAEATSDVDDERPISDQQAAMEYAERMRSAATSLFPAFYKSLHDDVKVWQEDSGVVVQKVPCDMIVLALEMKLRERAGNEGGGREMMVRIPDGWVKETDVQRIVAVPLGVLDE